MSDIVEYTADNYIHRYSDHLLSWENVTKVSVKQCSSKYKITTYGLFEGEERIFSTFTTILHGKNYILHGALQ